MNPEPEKVTADEILEKFKSERDEVLLSLNESKIRAFYQFWNNEDMPRNLETFWRAVHKAITSCKDLPLDFRKRSKAWLIIRKSESEDDGDL